MYVNEKLQDIISPKTIVGILAQAFVSIVSV